MRIALDIDGTITRCPEFFAFISRALMDAGHDVYIISYRQDRFASEQELAEYGVVYREMFLPIDEELDRDGFFEWKAEVCRHFGIDVFFEDMPEVINELDPKVVAFLVHDPNLGRVQYPDALTMGPSLRGQ